MNLFFWRVIALLLLGNSSAPATAASFICSSASDHYTEFKHDLSKEFKSITANVEFVLQRDGEYRPAANIYFHSAVEPKESVGFQILQVTEDGPLVVLARSTDPNLPDEEYVADASDKSTVSFQIDLEEKVLSARIEGVQKSIPLPFTIDMISFGCSTGEFHFSNILIQEGE
ncbi:hypothetical protein [Parasphingorhabdus sp.]|uniref:hypothetical protein n=1 Tax=Parasphingorhabdus sp. TaxID=2709688 RepID=UPI003C769A9F